MNCMAFQARRIFIVYLTVCFSVTPSYLCLAGPGKSHKEMPHKAGPLNSCWQCSQTTTTLILRFVITATRNFSQENNYDTMRLPRIDMYRYVQTDILMYWQRALSTFRTKYCLPNIGTKYVLKGIFRSCLAPSIKYI